MVWNSHLLKNLPQFVVIHTIPWTEELGGLNSMGVTELDMEMGIPDHLICLLRHLYAGQEATVRTGHGAIDWF